MADSVNQSSSASFAQSGLPQDNAPKGSSLNWQVTARTTFYIGITVIGVLAAFFLLVFPPTSVPALIAGLGVFYGAGGALALGPGIFEGSGGGGSFSLPPRRNASGSRASSNGSNSSSGSGSSSSSNPSQSSNVSSSSSSNIRPISPSITRRKLSSSQSQSPAPALQGASIKPSKKRGRREMRGYEGGISKRIDVATPRLAPALVPTPSSHIDSVYEQYLKKATLEDLKKELSSYKVDEMSPVVQDDLRLLLYQAGAGAAQDYVDRNSEDFRQFRNGESSESSSSTVSPSSIQPLRPDAPPMSPWEELALELSGECDVKEMDPLIEQPHLLKLYRENGIQSVRDYVKRREKGEEDSSLSFELDQEEETSRFSPAHIFAKSTSSDSIVFHDSIPPLSPSKSPALDSESDFEEVPEWLFRGAIRTNDSYPPRGKWTRTVVVAI